MNGWVPYKMEARETNSDGCLDLACAENLSIALEKRRQRAKPDAMTLEAARKSL